MINLKYICPNRKYVFNVFSGTKIMTDCGTCEVCNRKRNDRNFALLSDLCEQYQYKLFVTLTYNNNNLPTIKVVIKDGTITTYPLSARLFDDDDSQIYFNLINCEDNEENHDKITDFLARVNHDGRMLPNTFGVLYYKDVQDFFKRVRKNYFTQYKKKADFKYFVLSEYGAKYLRPHYHIIIFSNDESVRTFIEDRKFESPKCKNKFEHKDWKFGFCDVDRPKQNGMVASYVSSYVTSNNGSHFIFDAQKATKQGYNHSIGLHFSFINYLRCNRLFLQRLPLDDLENLQFRKDDKVLKLYDAKCYLCTLFPLPPYLKPRSIEEFDQLFRVFADASKIEFSDYFDSIMCLPFGYDVISYLRRDLQIHKSDYSDAEIELLLQNRVRQLHKWANTYIGYLGFSSIYNYSLIKKIYELHRRFEDYRTNNYFSFLSTLIFSSKSICDPYCEDVYSKQAHIEAKEKMKKNRIKKAHNNKVIHFD